MKKVFVGMSGGIDSSATAFLLKESGYEVIGVTFTAFREKGYKKCCSLEDIQAARKVCEFLKIPHLIIDVKDVFQTKIIKNFVDSYKKGLTPNPCILCNRFVKFGIVMEHALSEGADFFATGHYASTIEVDGEFFIRKGIDEARDQSYFLSFIEKEKLPFIILPNGKYLKKEIREIIHKAALPINLSKPESQDICFISSDYREFLREQSVPEKEGDFVYNGKKVGVHKGIPYYSYGQRRGLNIALGKRVYVRKFDLSTNKIFLGEKPLSVQFKVKNLNVFTKNFRNGEYSILVRYQSPFCRGSVDNIENSYVSVKLSKPCEIVAPGQYAVFYKGEKIYASGEIEEVELID